MEKSSNIFLQSTFSYKNRHIFPQKSSNFPAKINNFSYKNYKIFL